MSDKPHGRGGKREGAGRPKKEDRKRIFLSLGPNEAKTFYAVGGHKWLKELLHQMKP